MQVFVFLRHPFSHYSSVWLRSDETGPPLRCERECTEVTITLVFWGGTTSVRFFTSNRHGSFFYPQRARRSGRDDVGQELQLFIR